MLVREFSLLNLILRNLGLISKSKVKRKADLERWMRGKDRIILANIEINNLKGFSNAI